MWRISLRHGTITEFDYGVLLNPGSGGNIVSDLHLEMNQFAGIGLADADEGRVSGFRITDRRP
jgi:hypothetical protein